MLIYNGCVVDMLSTLNVSCYYHLNLCKIVFQLNSNSCSCVNLGNIVNHLSEIPFLHL